MDSEASEKRKPLLDGKDSDELHVPSSSLYPSLHYYDARVKEETPITGPNEGAVPQTNHEDIRALARFLFLVPFCGLVFLYLWALAAIFPVVIVAFVLRWELIGFYFMGDGWWAAAKTISFSALAIALMSRLLIFITLIRRRVLQGEGTNGTTNPGSQLSRTYSCVLFIYSVEFGLAAACVTMMRSSPSPEWCTSKPPNDINLNWRASCWHAIVFALLYMTITFGFALKWRCYQAEKPTAPPVSEEAPVAKSDAV